jgi:large subunit ribosomal protein L18
MLSGRKSGDWGNKMNDKQRLRLKRHRRVRGKVYGTASRPRLNVFRSLKHIYAQLIDDDKGSTLVSASTVEPSYREIGKTGGDIKAAEVIGEAIAKKALEAGIVKVVFDRGGYKYHGRVKSLADAARKGGLEF